MRRFTILLTNVMFVAHVLLGCCLHHAHARIADEATAHADCGHHHGHHAPSRDSHHGDDDDAAPSNVPTGDCDQCRCKFVKCESQRIEIDPTSIGWTTLAAAPILLPRCDTPLAATDRPAARPGDIPLEVLFCALLI